jgi:hypothetical protein
VIGSFGKIEKEDVRAGRLRRGESVSDDAAFIASFTNFLVPSAPEPQKREVRSTLLAGNFESLSDEALAKIIPYLTCGGPRQIAWSKERSFIAFHGLSVELTATGLAIPFKDAGVRMAAAPTRIRRH